MHSLWDVIKTSDPTCYTCPWCDMTIAHGAEKNSILGGSPTHVRSLTLEVLLDTTKSKYYANFSWGCPAWSRSKLPELWRDTGCFAVDSLV